MKLSRRARYALLMMVEITKESKGGHGKVSLSRVAENTKLSRRYLEQLAMALKNASLIVGICGKGGGYRLARPPEDIRVGQIVEAVIGPVNIVECILQPDLCVQIESCGCRKIYERINTRISGVLNEFSLADLASMSQEDGQHAKRGIHASGCPTG